MTRSDSFAWRLIGVPLSGALLTFAVPTAALAEASAQNPTAAAPDCPTVFTSLPNTDGIGLLPEPPAFSNEQLANFFQDGKQACDSRCVTDFGTRLGVADGVPGFSNCRSTCIKPQSSFLDLKTGAVSVHPEDPKQANLRYIGLTYQCVEYARRWWMQNLGITFGSVDGANEIIYLQNGINIRTQASVPLGRSINGVAKRPPQRGDLLVYYPLPDEPKWRWGHVAVVTDVDLDQGRVSIAEQNVTNAPWENPAAFARQIRLFQIADRYRVLDLPLTDHKNPTGALIAGWVYPLEIKRPISQPED